MQHLLFNLPVDSYLLFVLIAVIAVLTPGPGVIMTLSNALRSGLPGALAGISGIAAGTFLVATASATSLGVLLNTSATAFTVLKYLGSGYLFYLGFRLFRSPAMYVAAAEQKTLNWQRQFSEGVALQLSNPKAIFFFMAVLPQFVDNSTQYAGQFFLLLITYSMLVMLIHLFYARMAILSCHWLNSDTGSRYISRIGGGVFFGFGIGLALSSR